MKWPMVKFAQLVSNVGVFSDGDWIESKDQDPDGDVRLVQLADIGVGNFINKSNRFMTKEASERLKCTYLEPGDILIARMPDPIGRACLFPNEMGTCVTVVDICIVRPNSHKVHNKWLMHLINSSQFQNQIKKHVTGTTRQRISRGNLSKLVVSLPPLEEQKRIAAILDKADAIRRKRQQAIDIADEFLRSVFLDMFGDPISNNKKWNIKKLGELAPNKGDMVDGPFGSSVNTKTDYIDDGEIPVIRTKNISLTGEFVTDDLKFMTREKFVTIIRSNVVPGDIVLTKVGTIGNVCIFPHGFQEAVLSTTGSCRIRIDESRINKTYLYYFLKYYRPKMHEIASAGVQPFLNMKHIKGFEVPIPDKKLQEKFADIVNRTSGSKTLLNESSKFKLFESLSQIAFSGEL